MKYKQQNYNWKRYEISEQLRGLRKFKDKEKKYIVGRIVEDLLFTALGIEPSKKD